MCKKKPPLLASSPKKKAETVQENTDVIILCGGRGSRLRPLTDDMPKAMTPVLGRPMISHIIDFYHQNGFTRATICTGYKGDVMRKNVVAPSSDMEILFSDAGEQASMMQRLVAAGIDTRERTIVSYGDTFINLDMDLILAHHQQGDAALTIITAKITNPFGLVTYESGDKVSSFLEKPVLNYYIGCFVAEQSAFEFLTDQMIEAPDGEGLVIFFQALAAAGRLGGYEHEGLHITFNTEPEMRKANQQMEQFYTLQEKS